MLPARPLGGREFWGILAEPNHAYDGLLRAGASIEEFLYPKNPGRYTPETGIPALSMMVLPHLTDDPDGLLDWLEPQIRAWPVRPADQHYRQLFDVLCERFDRAVVIERSGYSLKSVPALRKAFPEARFVHSFRHGPDCALSMSRHPGFRMISLVSQILEAAGVESPAELTEDHVARLPEDLAELVRHGFAPDLVVRSEAPAHHLGKVWSQAIAEGTRHLNELPEDRHMALGYEQLLDAPERELTRLAEFTGLTPTLEWLAASRELLDNGRRGGSRRLPADQLRALEASCAPGMRILAGV
ncbi:sulfotransferase family protein [Streptomyces cinnamoneus]